MTKIFRFVLVCSGLTLLLTPRAFADVCSEMIDANSTGVYEGTPIAKMDPNWVQVLTSQAAMCGQGATGADAQALQQFAQKLQARQEQAKGYQQELIELLQRTRALPNDPSSTADLEKIKRRLIEIRNESVEAFQSNEWLELDTAIDQKNDAVASGQVQQSSPANTTGADSGETPDEPTDNASSFRGLQLGMTEAQLRQSLDQSFALTDKPAATETQVLTMLLEGMNGQAQPSLFIVKGQQACGQIMMRGGRVARLRLYQCYFDIGSGMSIDDFVRQIIDTYQLEDGMAGHWEMRGTGLYRFKYTEYVGVRQATSERFTASVGQMDNNLTLTVERVPHANFN
ncbi:hypothetical protein P9272_32080 [Mesorhizobium sp. WSM4976]|uniref:hypothetical protein n=1 Tax=Mesorhizobium sp. WSM4976 TaxID=3038549 RepID=UPI002417F987|nr:hypothetical protein [Mesorhizobium sp. WSM4976]MDG4898177.1 hypothetical protein [Mesorhizobium sp. WSM4976]